MDDYIAKSLEQYLRDVVRLEQERRWLRENREAIASINAFLDRHGLLASRLRLPPRVA
jgi:post-segregation antitoxin (ccd killing protein)